MNERSLLFRKPSLIVALAVYAAAFILLLSGGVFYGYASDLLYAQREDILDKATDLTVRELDSELTALSASAQRVRSSLRYIAMPPQAQLSAETRIALREGSLAFRKELLGVADAVKAAYIYAPEAGYALMIDSVRDVSALYALYDEGGFTRAEVDALHGKLSQGRLEASANKKQMVYLLSIGKHADTGAPVRQIVLILKRNYLMSALLAGGAPGAAYTLSAADGTMLDEAATSSIANGDMLRRYELESGYVLSARVSTAGYGSEVDAARRVYLIAILAGLAAITGVTLLACRFSALPVNRLIDYISSRYGAKQGEGLTAIRAAVDELWESRESAERQLREYHEARLLGSLTSRLRSGGDAEEHVFNAPGYALILFTPAQRDRNALMSAVGSLTSNDAEYAPLDLEEGFGLMAGVKTGETTDEFALALAEDILSAFDDEQPNAYRAAVSACHTTLAELPDAYREARMALEGLLMLPDMPVLTYKASDGSVSVLARDTEYLARQQRLNRLAATGQYAQAAELLSTLVPPDFMSETAARSETGHMHLEMVKYQMMALTEKLYTGTEDDLEMRREALRTLLSCTTHETLLSLMRARLMELAEADTPDAPESDDAIAGIKLYVRQSYADPQMSVTSLAEHFGMTPNTLSKLFSRKAGMGVSQYIHKIRIENACTLMLSTSLPLAEIAERTGYSNTLTFGRAFKTRYHMTPSEWRGRRAGEPLDS